MGQRANPLTRKPNPNSNGKHPLHRSTPAATGASGTVSQGAKRSPAVRRAARVPSVMPSDPTWVEDGAGPAATHPIGSPLATRHHQAPQAGQDENHPEQRWAKGYKAYHLTRGRDRERLHRRIAAAYAKLPARLDDWTAQHVCIWAVKEVAQTPPVPTVPAFFFHGVGRLETTREGGGRRGGFLNPHRTWRSCSWRYFMFFSPEFAPHSR